MSERGHARGDGRRELEEGRQADADHLAGQQLDGPDPDQEDLHHRARLLLDDAHEDVAPEGLQRDEEQHRGDRPGEHRDPVEVVLLVDVDRLHVEGLAVEHRARVDAGLSQGISERGRRPGQLHHGGGALVDPAVEEQLPLDQPAARRRRRRRRGRGGRPRRRRSRSGWIVVPTSAPAPSIVRHQLRRPADHADVDGGRPVVLGDAGDHAAHEDPHHQEPGEDVEGLGPQPLPHLARGDQPHRAHDTAPCGDGFPEDLGEVGRGEGVGHHGALAVGVGQQGGGVGVDGHDEAVPAAGALPGGRPGHRLGEVDVDVAHGRARPQVGDVALEDHLPAVDDHHVGGDVAHQIELVARQEQGRAPADLLLEDLREVLHGQRVEPRERLVEHEELRLAEQRQGQLHPLLVAAGQALDGVVGPVREVEPLEPAVGDRAGLVGPQAGEPGVVHEVVAHPHALVHPALGRHVPDAAAHALVDRRAVPLHASAIEGDETDDRPHGRGLPGAVGSEEADDLAALHGEAHPVERHHVAEALS